jgi:hypothetical protein
MRLKKIQGCFGIALLASSLVTCLHAQGNRGAATLKTPGGPITIDYGRPALKGRDMIDQLQDGMVWRMGNNTATVLNTPVDLMFGSTPVNKGSYSLWLEKSAGGKFQLVFNSQTGQWGTMHDPQKDVHKVALKREALSSPVEVFTIELKQAGAGGSFQMSWGNTKLSSDFQFMK